MFEIEAELLPTIFYGGLLLFLLSSPLAPSGIGWATF